MQDVLSVLRSEFEAQEGSFLVQLRSDLRWDRAAFTRLTQAMLEYVRSRQSDSDIPRWIAQGFWYLDGFVRDWSMHANFPREHDSAYYSAALDGEYAQEFLQNFGKLVFGQP